MIQEYALTKLGPDIRSAAEMLSTEWPDVADADQLVAEISLFLLDREIASDLEELEHRSRRVWFLWAIADKLVRTEIYEYQRNTGLALRPRPGTLQYRPSGLPATTKEEN